MKELEEGSALQLDFSKLQKVAKAASPVLPVVVAYANREALEHSLKTGIATFKNARIVQATAQDVAADKFMVETDCPYLAPAPNRGKRCEPADTRKVADKIAQLRGVGVEEIAARTTQTAREFFRFARG